MSDFRRQSIKKFGPLVGAIDAGTSSVRFIVFAAETAEMLTYHQKEIKQYHPKEGWVEQDPVEIINTVKECMERTVENLLKLEIDPNDVITLGITNQRETVIVWDSASGSPLYNAIVWLDMRTKEIVDRFVGKTKKSNPEFLKPLCGLPISTYFSALKFRWLLENVPQVESAISEKRCMFGTIDSWLVWNLTGGPNGGIHITDVTNASRTMLMNIDTLEWDPTLLKFFQIPADVLPKIKSCSEIYGYIFEGSLRTLPISGCLGDQQAALMGQLCLKRGQTKITYGTGCFLLCNTGGMKVWSNHGLLTTVAYKLGPKAPTVYALEGSVAIAGAAISWLVKNLEIMADMGDIEKMMDASSPNSIVYFVPAFSGLYAPYWRKDARGVICGLGCNTAREDVLKSVLNAVCFQTRDLLQAMSQDCGEASVAKILADGGLTVNDYLMQLQADMVGVHIVRPIMTETTALGAAMAAGCAKGINVWDLSKMQAPPSDIFYPRISEDERDIKYDRWKMAIERSLNWEIPLENEESEEARFERKMFRMIPGSLFVLISFGLLIIASRRFPSGR